MLNSTPHMGARWGKLPTYFTTQLLQHVTNSYREFHGRLRYQETLRFDPLATEGPG